MSRGRQTGHRSQDPVAQIGASVAEELYRRMLLIRRFEETAIKLASQGKIAGQLHPSIGHEAAIVGACMALEPSDYILGTHRSHGHPIAKGADVRRLMAELLGKATGCCRGKGGTMHLADFSVGSLGETSIVGSGLPVAAGAALGSKLRGLTHVTLCFFGDGAANEGTFHEALNLASVWRLPVVYFCENNGYGELTPYREVTPVEDIASRASSYGFPGMIVDGQDVFAVYGSSRTAVAHAREGRGPYLVEAKTYRFENHAFALPAGDPRSRDEIDRWRARDPIALARTSLTDGGGLDEQRMLQIESAVDATIETAVEFAASSPDPDPDEAFDDLFATPIN